LPAQADALKKAGRFDSPDSYDEENRQLLRARGKLSCMFGITLVPIFSILDYVFVPHLWFPFFLLRAANTLQNIALYTTLDLGKNLSARKLNWLMTFYFCSIGIMIAYMCRRMGGYDSTYYAGLNIVMLVVGLVMPWNALYTAVNGLIIYAAFVVLGYRPGFQVADLVNSSFFLLSTDLIASVASWWTDRYRRNEFNTRRELKALDRAKSIFFANVSHELKTPMTLVLTPLEYAFEKTPSREKEIRLNREAFEAIRHNAYRLSGLISDLLDLTRGEIGKERVRAAAIRDTEGYFRKIFEAMTPLMEEKGLGYEFERTVRASLKPHYFDRTKLEKVVVNLLSNAVKFTPKGGKISMRVWDQEENGYDAPVLKIRVADTGIGIPREKIPYIFERFMQVDDSSTRAYSGMGIGLSLVKDFVEQHGGWVEVESEVGGGTRMTVTLPRGREHFRATVIEGELIEGELIEEGETVLPVAAGGHAPDGEEAEEPSAGRQTVLVIDDTADMRYALREILKERYRVVSAQDGIDGYEAARREKPDLIISDIMMPRRDGYGLIADLKNDPECREIPVILLTAKSGGENIASAFQRGADDYVEKPFQPREVISRAEKLLRIRRQNEEIRRQKEDLEEVNRRLKETQAELVQTEKLSTVGVLAAGVAHEINNPAYSVTLSLANIESLLEKLSPDGTIDPRILERLRHHLARGQEEISRIKKTVKTLLSYSRKNSEGIALRNLRQDIEATLTLLKSLIGESCVAIHWNPDMPVKPIEADHGALNQLLTNLVQNAIQAGSKNVWIEADQDESTCRLRVADDGSGIPPEVMPHIFEPFFTTKEVGQGTGLGLSIVHRIVEAHHGEIMVTSQVGQGSAFTVILPMKQPTVSHQRPASSAEVS
jgi:signal transduction histidine kinase